MTRKQIVGRIVLAAAVALTFAACADCPNDLRGTRADCHWATRTGAAVKDLTCTIGPRGTKVTVDTTGVGEG